jgi:hypothetical protein
MHEHGESSKGLLVVDLLSGEEDAFPDTSRDEEIDKKVFGDLNRELLRPLGDDNVIVLINSNKEEEVCEGSVADAKAVPSSTVNSLAPAASTAANADALNGVQDGSSGRSTLDQVQGDSSDGGD